MRSLLFITAVDEFIMISIQISVLKKHPPGFIQVLIPLHKHFPFTILNPFHFQTITFLVLIYVRNCCFSSTTSSLSPVCIFKSVFFTLHIYHSLLALLLVPFLSLLEEFWHCFSRVYSTDLTFYSVNSLLLILILCLYFYFLGHF